MKGFRHAVIAVVCAYALIFGVLVFIDVAFPSPASLEIANSGEQLS